MALGLSRVGFNSLRTCDTVKLTLLIHSHSDCKELMHGRQDHSSKTSSLLNQNFHLKKEMLQSHMSSYGDLVAVQ